jgi:hypothetical protein
MIRSLCLLLMFFYGSSRVMSQDSLVTFQFGDDVIITLDLPSRHQHKKTIIIFYALPNGNTTRQTTGLQPIGEEKPTENVQHILAQTKFIRATLKNTNVIVAYLETVYHSWPLWKTKHADYIQLVQRITDTIWNRFPSNNKELYLNGHSGGGRFIFSYLDGVNEIPSYVKRISFLDSNYGYDSSYLPKFTHWIDATNDHYLNVFAYNDSIALYQGKPFVSATGGTWYRSYLMLKELASTIPFEKKLTDSLIIYTGHYKRVQFFLKPNYDRGIYHTKQVELNGFIHSVLCGTTYDSKNYKYYGNKVYDNFIE